MQRPLGYIESSRNVDEFGVSPNSGFLQTNVILRGSHRQCEAVERYSYWAGNVSGNSGLDQMAHESPNLNNDPSGLCFVLTDSTAISSSVSDGGNEEGLST